MKSQVPCLFGSCNSATSQDRILTLIAKVIFICKVNLCINSCIIVYKMVNLNMVKFVPSTHGYVYG